MNYEQRAENYKALEDLRDQLNNSMYPISQDFINDYYDITTSHYLGDNFTEFSDSMVSIYYKDQFDYYEENTTECEDALLELYDGDTLADIIKKQGLYNLCCTAGVCGWFRDNESKLWEDKQIIIQLLLLNYIIENWNSLIDEENPICDWEYSKIKELIDNLDEYEIDRMSDILDYFTNNTEKVED